MSIRAILRRLIWRRPAPQEQVRARDALIEASGDNRNVASKAAAHARISERMAQRSSVALEGVIESQERYTGLRRVELDFVRQLRGE